MSKLISQYITRSQETLGAIPVDDVERGINAIVSIYRQNGTWFLAGNGGSAADAQHIAAEMVGRFVTDRPALPALSLSDNVSSLTSISNDYSFDDVFSRQLQALSQPNDVFLGISTSGQSQNIINAVTTARDLGLYTIGLSGHNGGRLQDCVDCSIVIPSTTTALIQQAHITVGHLLCMGIEQALFGHHQ